MKRLSSLNPLFIFEMANNHMGSVEHGLTVIRQMRRVADKFPFNFGFKLQYRHLDTFIHPDYRDRLEFKYVKRFSETRLQPDELKKLKDEITAQGFVSICTPFDEKSVDLIIEHDFDIIKVASCSLTDWLLLEKIVLTDKPIIASTAGASLEEMDKTFSFFEHRDKDFAILHCVAEYPTDRTNQQLNQIDLFKSRYPEVPVGYSTHEHPDDSQSIMLAIAKGGVIFEKHVGVPTETIKLNGYSANPNQVEQWLRAAEESLAMCGVSDKRRDFNQAELASLHELRRGAYAAHTIEPGQKISPEDLVLAIPVFPGQVTANHLSKYTEFFALKEIGANEPILFDNVRHSDIREMVYDIVDKVKNLLDESNVVCPNKADFEVSHHYGIDQFYKYGSTMITVVNRDYCKKLIIMLPGQKHPEQHHKVKEETFHVLYGELRILLDGKETICRRGDIVVVEKGVKHSFSTTTGAVIEELSSTHLIQDSFYTDPTISKNSDRKTLLTYWMR